MKIFLLGALLFSYVAMAEEVHVKISGMVCSMCAQGIQKKFKNENSVHHISVNMDQKLVLLHTKDGEKLSDERIKALVTEAGYNVAEITRK